MKILLVTSSARGHAIADALARSTHKPEIINICPSRNPGIEALSSVQYVHDILDFPFVLEIAKKHAPDFAIIGPDDPIAQGLADELAAIGIKSVAPKKSLARVESSKGFTRDLMKKYGIDASPKFKVFKRIPGEPMSHAKESRELRTFIEEDLQGNCVVKYDALKGGKGVKVMGEHIHSVDEAMLYAQECLGECGQVVIEEKLVGVEFSLLSFVSGETCIDMPAVQDHKRAHLGDTGPNTGGMGTYTDANHSLPFLEPEDLKKASQLNQVVAKALKQECGEDYVGILYGGFIAVKDGIRVIEYNARFGDPEALNILPLLESDFVDLCLSMINGTLKPEDVRFKPAATVCKYIVPKSYPEAKLEKGQLVLLPASVPENARLYYGDISIDDLGNLHLGGSRTVGIVGIAPTIAEAEEIAEKICAQVVGPVRYRSDIATTELLQKRTLIMQALRGSK